MRRVTLLAPAWVAALVLLATSRTAQADGAAPAAVPPAAAGTEAKPVMPEGLVPLIDYTGDLWSRQRLVGDLAGARTEWAEKGIQFDVDFTQIMQSVVDGGRRTGTRYGGTLDYNLNLDLHRMGLLPGAQVKFRAETRYGEAVNDLAGPILPVSTDGFFPLTDDLDDDVPITVTDLTYIQFLAPQIGVLLGKFDTLDGDPNEFASGRGTSQFMNGYLAFPTSPMLMAPYSTLGAGIILMPADRITVSSIVYNIADSSTTTGFEDFGEGTVSLTEAQFKYNFGDLPGGQNVGFGFGFDADFAQLDERFVFVRGEGISKPHTDKTWAAYWSNWQYLWVSEPSEAPIDLTNGEPDRQGVGLFARAGFADRDTNPIGWTVSGGIGGKGIIPTRERDTFGLGYYYTRLRTDRLTDRIGVDDHSEGFEAFYSFSITPATSLTFDVQVVDSPFPDVDTALILGLRLRVRF